MSNANTAPLDPKAHAILERVARGDKLFHASPGPRGGPVYYFAESGEAEAKESVSEDDVAVLRTRKLIRFPPFSDLTYNQWVVGDITEDGKMAVRKK